MHRPRSPAHRRPVTTAARTTTRTARGCGRPPVCRRAKASASWSSTTNRLSDPVEALTRLRADPQRFDLVLTDELMPELCGTALAAEVRALRPDLPVLMASGWGGAQLNERACGAGVCRVLAKPLDLATLAQAVHAALQPQGDAAGTAPSPRTGS
ncbi:MAG: hypothetical protein RL223_3297 [Pseudomonadota bacterium]